MKIFFKKLSLWASNKNWLWRLPILAWFIVVLVQNIEDKEYSLNRLGNPLSAIDFGIHEMGHFIFMPFGEFMHIAGGSIFQLFVPLLAFVGFLQQRWYFAASLAWCWVGLNLFDIATYAADARARLLPLVTPASLGGGGDEVYDQAHDWYQLLSRLDMLEQDLAIANGLRIAAIICFVIGLSFAAFLLVLMIRSQVRNMSSSEKLH